MSIPTIDETYMKLREHLRLAQEDAAMLAHLHNDTSTKGRIFAKGWLTISEAIKLMLDKVMQLMQGRLN